MTITEAIAIENALRRPEDDLSPLQRLWAAESGGGSVTRMADPYYREAFMAWLDELREAIDDYVASESQEDGERLSAVLESQPSRRS